jgi:pentatricopeptide repeat protein
MKLTHAASGGSDDVDCKPDAMAATAIAGCSEAKGYTHALLLMVEMRREGIRPNIVMFLAAINVCATASAKLVRKRKEEDTSSGVHGNINNNGDDTIKCMEDGKG